MWMKTLENGETIVLSFFHNVFKRRPFLNRRNSGMFGTKTYTRGTDFLLSKKKATNLISGKLSVFKRIERSRKILYFTHLSFEDGDESI